MNTQIVEAIAHNPEADSFDFQKSLEMIKQALFCHKLLIASTIFLTLFIVIVYMMAFPANYEAKVVLIADSSKDMQREEFYRYWNMFRNNSLADEGELMTSNLIIGKVVDSLELGYGDVYHSFTNHLGYLWVESWIGKNYRAIKYWIFPRKVLYSLTPEEFERGKTIKSFKDGIELQPVPDTNIGILIARGPSPRIADIVNTMVNLYLEERKIRMTIEADTAYNALKTEVDKASGRLNAIEKKIEEHYEQNNMLLAFEKDKLQVTRWIELQATIVESEAKLAYIVATLKEIDRQLGMENKDVVTSRVLIKNSARVKLRDQIVQLQISLEQAKLRYNTDAPEVTEIIAQINALTRLWKEEEKIEEAQSTELISETYQALLNRKSTLLSEMKGLRANLKVKKASERATANKLKALPAKSNITHDLERERALLEKRYTGLSDKLTTAAVSKATILSAPPSIRVVDYAEYPEKPYWPKPKFLIIGAIIFGGIMGLLAAIILDFVYGRVSRYRLSSTSSHRAIYAIVARDTEFLARLYGLPSTIDGSHRGN